MSKRLLQGLVLLAIGGATAFVLSRGLDEDTVRLVFFAGGVFGTALGLGFAFGAYRYAAAQGTDRASEHHPPARILGAGAALFFAPFLVGFFALQ
jgi:hypothetical protein